MHQAIKRRDALKSIAAIGGLLALPGIASAASGSSRNNLSGGWLYQGQPCIIIQQGAIFLLINEIGSVGSAVLNGSTLTVLGGAGWDVGLTGELSNRNRTISWSNGTVWTQGRPPSQPVNLDGSWLYQGQPCAIFQQGNFFILINEIGSLGSGIWNANNSLTTLGGAGWDVGLVGLVANNGNTINWSNATTWTRA